MLYATARAWVGEHVHDRLVWIRNEYLAPPVPDGLRAKERLLLDVSHNELHTLNDMLPTANLSGREDAQASEDLFG